MFIAAIKPNTLSKLILPEASGRIFHFLYKAKCESKEPSQMKNGVQMIFLLHIRNPDEALQHREGNSEK